MNNFLQPGNSGPLSPDKTYRVIGIDLGTTNSSVAEITWNPASGLPPDLRMIEVEQDTPEGNYTDILVPSIVARHNGRDWIGEGAKRLRALAVDYGLAEKRDLFSECKNDIGVKRTYHQAPAGLRSAVEVSGRLLSFLRDKALRGQSPDRIVVTVPASFQSSQRSDTLKAIELAGFTSPKSVDLLDEPLAAFLHAFLSETEIPPIPDRSNLLVFDFGGGTCDVAIFRIEAQESSFGVQPLAVSRYHRCGGGDIDRAIVHEILIPQLVKQNKLERFRLEFSDKKNLIEPALIGAAESLKIGLCKEIKRLRDGGVYTAHNAESLSKTLPITLRIPWKDGHLELASPIFWASELNALLKPFLDTDALYAKETEFRVTTSIFGPLQDALDRARLDADDIGICLLAGGSSLLPPVSDALLSFFPNARHLTFKDDLSAQTAIAKGAAWHALMLETRGKGLFHPVASEQIALKTQEGHLDLLPVLSELPYSKSFRLTTPRSSENAPYEMQIEIMRRSDESLIERRRWTIPRGVAKGEPLSLEVSMNENQVFDLRVNLENRHDIAPLWMTVENPLTHVISPHHARVRIETIEEEMRVASLENRLKKRSVADKFFELGDRYRELDQYEKALDCYKRSLAAKGAPDTLTLIRMASSAESLGDYDREEKFLRDAAAHSKNDWVPFFNLAISKEQQGLLDEAVSLLLGSLERQRTGDALSLLAEIELKRSNKTLADRHLAEALKTFRPVELEKSEATLSWHHSAARLAGRTELENEITMAIKKLKTEGEGEKARSESDAWFPSHK